MTRDGELSNRRHLAYRLNEGGVTVVFGCGPAGPQVAAGLGYVMVSATLFDRKRTQAALEKAIRKLQGPGFVKSASDAILEHQKAMCARYGIGAVHVHVSNEGVGVRLTGSKHPAGGVQALWTPASNVWTRF